MTPKTFRSSPADWTAPSEEWTVLIEKIGMEEKA